MNTKIAAILIEKWKLSVFSRHLKEAGFSYDTAPGLRPELMTLRVEYENVDCLAPVVGAAQAECAKAKK